MMEKHPNRVARGGMCKYTYTQTGKAKVYDKERQRAGSMFDLASERPDDVAERNEAVESEAGRDHKVEREEGNEREA